MAGMISTQFDVLKQSATLRYSLAIFLVIVVLYLLALGMQARPNAGSVPANATAETNEIESLHKAPKEALFESKQIEQSTITQANDSNTTTIVQTEQSAKEASSDETSSSTTVTINGKRVRPDTNGEVHKVIRSGSQHTAVDISSSSQSNSTAESSLDISIESSSTRTN